MKLRTYESLREQVYYAKLDNGLPVYVIKKPGFQKNFACFMTDYGGADRRFKYGGEWLDTPAGIAHFLEHKLFDMPDGSNTLATLAANGASPNASTSSTSTQYYFEGTEKFYENLEILLNYVSTPYFTPESVAKEQGIIAQEIRGAEDNPGYNVYYGLAKLLLQHHPLRDSVAGTVESIAEITDDVLYHCHSIFYNPSNMCLVAAGDVDPGKIVDMARNILPAQAGELPKRDYGAAEPHIPSANRGEKKMQVSMPIFYFGCSHDSAPRGEGMFRDAIIAETALHLLAGPSAPLYLKMYAERTILSFGAGIESGAGINQLIFTGMAPDPETVFDKTMEEIRRVQREGADAAMFELYKKRSFGAILRVCENFSSLCMAVANWHFLGFDYLNGLDIVNGMTLDDVNAFIRDNLDPEKFAMFVVRPLDA